MRCVCIFNEKFNHKKVSYFYCRSVYRDSVLALGTSSVGHNFDLIILVEVNIAVKHTFDNIISSISRFHGGNTVTFGIWYEDKSLRLSCQSLRKEGVIKNYFSCFSTKTYVVGTQKNRFNETVLLGIPNKCLN